MAVTDGREEGVPRSVFSAPDQREMIARLDAVDDDDLESSFFSTSVQEAEDAAVRMFDVGIRTWGDEDGAGVISPFPGLAQAPPAPAPALETSTAMGLVGSPVRGLTFDEPSVRAAFILGGPAAVTESG